MVRSASADLRARGRFSAADVETASGDEPAGADEGPGVEVRATTMSGDVRVVHANARAELPGG